MLYNNIYVPIEHIEIISVIIEEFVDNFHHGKEEKAYFPETKGKDNYSEDVRKFLIEHELGRRIANMLRREIRVWREKEKSGHLNKNDTGIKEIDQMEPIARFLKSYAVFIDDHTGKEDKFFDLIMSKAVITNEEDKNLLKHYELCKNQVGGKERIEEMIKLIEYLEVQDWMKSIN
jgi:hemerythrin-like domain-containing protein